MRIDDVVAVVLTGGQSRRMGQDKATLVVEGARMGETIVASLQTVCARVTVLGPASIGAAQSIADENPASGPLAALAAFRPSFDYCFVASCDLPRFDGEVVRLFRDKIGGKDAVIPSIEGRQQPLCALYSARAWSELAELASHNETRIMAWVRELNCVAVTEETLAEAGISPHAVRGVNTKEELASLLAIRLESRKPLD